LFRVYRRYPRLDAVLPAVPGTHAGLARDTRLLAQLLPLLPGETRCRSALIHLPSCKLSPGTSQLLLAAYTGTSQLTGF
jgi:hypothetical protein